MVVNYTGADTWVKSLRCLRKGGRLVTCGATAGFDPKEDLRYIWTYELNILGSNGWEREDILQVLASVHAGNLKIPLDRTFSLTDTQNAFLALKDRQVFGKVVVLQS